MGVKLAQTQITAPTVYDCLVSLTYFLCVNEMKT